VTVSGDCRALADDLGPVVARALAVTARDAKTRFVAVAAAATGGDGRLSRVGKRGAKLSARYDVIDDTHTVIKAVGPWQHVEHDRRGGYPIPKGKGKGPNRRRKRPRLLVGGQWRTGPITGGAIHRGDRGPWHRATPDVVAAAGDRIVADMLDAIDRVLR
jgi:hypothetical protein